MEQAYLLEQITATKATIAALQAAVVAIGTNAEASFTINTGQTVTTVTKLNIKDVNDLINSLYNQLTVMCVRARVIPGSIQMVPGW